MSARVSAEQLFECFQKPLSAVALRRIFMLMLRVHWSDEGNYGEWRNELGCLTYSDEDPKTLEVTMDYLLDTKKPIDYPAVIVKFGALQMQKNTLDNFAGMTGDYGSSFYAMPAKTVMTVAHIHENADTAAVMADSTATFLMGTREPTMRRLNLRAFDLAAISEIKLIEKAPSRYFNVEVSAQLDFNMAVTVNLEGHRLKKFGQELNPEPA